MDKRENSSAIGSMWRFTKKETFGVTAAYMERQSQERCTDVVPYVDWHILAMIKRK
jgi:hypothetical protein